MSVKINLIAFCMIISGVILSSCSPQVYPSSEVQFEGKKNRDVIILNSVGYGKSEVSAIKDAEYRAFQVVLFRGLPNSELRNPLIDNEEEAKRKHQQYFANLFEQQGYRNHISFSTPSNSFVKDRASRLKKTEARVGINISSLRKDLEKNGIIKKFGF